MLLPQPEQNFKYLAIDCNHRLKAFQRLGIKTAMALVFPPLEEDIYTYVAGIYFYTLFYFLKVLQMNFMTLSVFKLQIGKSSWFLLDVFKTKGSKHIKV